MAEASNSDLKGVLEINEDPIVSIDIIVASASSIYDSTLSNSYGKMVGLFLGMIMNQDILIGF